MWCSRSACCGTGTSPATRPWPPISRLWFRPYPNFGAALAGFTGGEVHGLGHIPADQVAGVAALPGVEMHEQTLARYSLLILNTQSPLLDRAETRQAIESA